RRRRLLDALGPVPVLDRPLQIAERQAGVFFFSSRRRHTRWPRDWSSDVCSSDLKLLIGNVFHQLQQTRIASEKVLADVGAGFDDELLVFAVNHFSHALDQQALGIPLEDRIPIAAPDDLDDIPAGSAKNRLEFLNNLA